MEVIEYGGERVVRLTANFDGGFKFKEDRLLHEDFSGESAQERHVLLLNLHSLALG